MNNIKTYGEHLNELSIFKGKTCDWKTTEFNKLERMGFIKIENSNDSPIYYVPTFFTPIKNVTIKYLEYRNKKYYEIELTMFKHHSRKSKKEKVYNFQELIKKIKRYLPELI